MIRYLYTQPISDYNRAAYERKMWAGHNVDSEPSVYRTIEETMRCLGELDTSRKMSASPQVGLVSFPSERPCLGFMRNGRLGYSKCSNLDSGLGVLGRFRTREVMTVRILIG